MSRSQQALIIEELWSETQRLNAEIAALQMRLSQYEDIEYSSPAENEKMEAEPDVWNVWPYSWAISAHRFISERFHSFHEKLIDTRLTRDNRRARVAFWDQPHHEDTPLKLI